MGENEPGTSDKCHHVCAIAIPIRLQSQERQLYQKHRRAAHCHRDERTFLDQETVATPQDSSQGKRARCGWHKGALDWIRIRLYVEAQGPASAGVPFPVPGSFLRLSCVR